MRALVSLLVAATLLPAATQAGAPRLVRDINPTIIPVDSTPGGLLDQGSWSFFTASDGVHPSEPWATDGTATGTVRLGAINALPGGISGYQTTRLGGVTYFMTNGATFGSSALWRSDGTATGTRAVLDFSTSAGESGGIVGVMGNQLVLHLLSPARGPELWRSDGTAAGTVRIPDLAGLGSTVNSYAIANDRIYFLRAAAGGTYEPWVYDGTQNASRRLLQTPGFSATFAEFIRIGNQLLFNANTPGAGNEIWRIDLNTEAVSLLADIAPGPTSGVSEPPQFGTLGNIALFLASASGGNPTLWRSDGTTAGTFQVAPLQPISEVPRYGAPSTANRALFRVSTGGSAQLWSTDGSTATSLGVDGYCVSGMIGGVCYFTQGNSELWRTDGTPAGTRRLAGISGDLSSLELAGSATRLFLRLRGSNGVRRIYSYDLASDAATLIWTYTLPLPITPEVFAFAQGRLYFDGGDPVTGRELWTSDGTASGTRLLRNIAPETRTAPSSPQHLFAFNGQLYFSADDGIAGRELWKSDGTAGGTQRVADLNPGLASSDPVGFFTLGGRLFFLANNGPDASYFKLWTTDGTAVGTTLVAPAIPRTALFGGQAPCGAVAAVLGANAYLSIYEPGFYAALARTDGTTAGTVRINDGSAQPVRDPCWLTTFQDNVFFASAHGAAVGLELWSAAPNQVPALFADLNPGATGSAPTELTVFNNRLYLVATGPNGRQLWFTNGTATPTQAVTSFVGKSPTGLSVAGDKLFFYSNEPASPQGAELWVTQGADTGATRLGTVIAKSPLQPVGPRVYFSARSDSGQGLTPWVSDGTVEGTFSLSEPGAAGVSNLLNWDFNGTALIQTADGSLNSKLWRSNGTRAGTAVIGDMGVASTSLYPVTHLASGRSFFYVADSGGSGAELYAVDNDGPLVADDNAGSVPAGQPLVINVTANDSDPGGAVDAASVIIDAQPAHGSVTVSASGAITYTAILAYTGPDQFAYTVSDNQGNRSWPATVRVNVTPAPPSSGGGGSGGGGGSTGGGGGSLELSGLLGLLWLARRKLLRAIATVAPGG